MMQLLDYEPHNFIKNHSKKDLMPLRTFVHRTFNGTDLQYFVKSLAHIYKNNNGLEAIFSYNNKPYNLQERITILKKGIF